MAPVKPRRPTARAKASRSSTDPRGIYAPPPTGPDDITPDHDTNDHSTQRHNYMRGEIPSADGTFSLFADTFKTSKKDKRTIKHNALLNKVHAAGISKDKRQKRRRPATKKLNTDIGDLADALPDVDEGDDEWEGISEDGEGMQVEGSATKRRRRKRKVQSKGKMVMTSLEHKPGAMKKKALMEERERERFRKNLAQMMAGQQGHASKGGGEGEGIGKGHSDRWAALRRFIGSTMEKDRAFAGA